MKLSTVLFVLIVVVGLAGCGAVIVNQWNAAVARNIPAPGHCIQKITYNQNWNDDYMCARSDGSIFRTGSAQADRFQKARR